MDQCNGGVDDNRVLWCRTIGGDDDTVVVDEDVDAVVLSWTML